MSEHVRPTWRALADLGRSLPPLDGELHLLDDALLQKAQALPAEVAAGGAERIRALTDRVWFKVKTADLRGASGEAETPEAFGLRTDADLPSAAWWLVAADIGKTTRRTATSTHYWKRSASAQPRAPRPR